MDEVKKGKKRIGEDDVVDPIYDEMAKKHYKQYHPYYLPRLLMRMFSLEEAKIAMELPATPAEIAKRLNVSEKYVESKLEKLVMKGCLLRKQDGSVVPLYSRMQIGDFSCHPAFDDERGLDYFPLLSEWVQDKEGGAESEAALMLQVAGKRPMTRVIPKWKAIKDIPGVMPAENILEILKGAEKLASTRCPCRHINKHLHGECSVHNAEGKGFRQAPWDGFCIKLDRTAEYYVEAMKIAPYLSVEDVMKKVEQLDNTSSYHITTNNRIAKAFCNCCPDHCDVRTVPRNFPAVKLSMFLDPSRFLSVVDTEKCNGSGVCASMCPFEAVVVENGKAKVDSEKCMGCGVCVLNCPDEALKLKIVRPPEHIPVGGDQDIFYKIFTTPLDE